MKRILISAIMATSFALPAQAQTAKDDVVDFGTPVPMTIVSENGPHTFSTEVADTLDKQARGMMYRETMGSDTGMLFAFKEPKIATIWMKNTSIPLDILFVRTNGKILKIEHSHKPYTLRSASSEASVAAVVELAGGRSKELGIQPGDLVKHSFFGTE